MKKKILNSAEPIPPKALQIPSTFNNHGNTRIDPYFWMRDVKHPETMPYLNAENKYFQENMKPLETLKKKLYTEMKGRIPENDSSAPAPNGNFEYYSEYKKGLEYPLFFRRHKKQFKVTKPVLLLDQNKFAKGKKYCSLGTYLVSPRHDLLAFSFDFDGSEKYTIEIKDIASNKKLNTRLEHTNGNAVFSADQRYLFYTVLDSQLRPYKIFRHELYSNKADVLVYEEKDAQFFASVNKSSSGNYIFINTGGKITSEYWIIDAHNPTLAPRLFNERSHGLEYNVEHYRDHFWILTNHKAVNNRLMKTSLDLTTIENWKEFRPHNADTYLIDFTFKENHLILSERESGLIQIKIIDMRSLKEHSMKFKDSAYEISVSQQNYEFHSNILRINYSSPITPNSVIDYNLDTKKSSVIKTQKVKGHHSKKYVCERVWVTSHDGVKVPLVLLYKKGLKKNKKNPTYLYGYGSYGMILPDAFPSRRDVYRLVDRGYVYALAHIRGGAEMGRHWYDNGKFLKKKNTFQDFIACGEWLKNSGWSHPQKLAICGGSAGGMLVGACMNMRPDLFDLVVAHVPFVDVINTMLDKDLPLTQIEYDEWGNPENKEYYHYMKSYSPYDNVERKNYPSMFVTCGLNDPRVTYWEPAKWVAKLREFRTDKNPLLFKINMGAGHFGTTGRFEYLWEFAEEFAFVITEFSKTK